MNSKIRTALYVFFLNSDYVAVRSLHALRSNQLMLRCVCQVDVAELSNTFKISLLKLNLIFRPKC